MNIEESLLNLVKPPRHKVRNYQGRHAQFLGSFSRYTNAIQSFDNCCISFTLLKNIKTSAKAKTCIVYSHSHGSTGEEGLELLEACHDQGASLCCYDSRGCGESGDGYVTFGVNESIDLLYVCFYLVVIYEIDEFILWGRSIGSCAVLQLTESLVSSMPRKSPTGILRSGLSRVSGPNSPKAMNLKQPNWASDFSLESHLSKFLELNNFINENPRHFSIIGLVVDSAPKSIIAAVEHFVKVKFLNLKLFSKVAALYSENWIKKNTGVDITIRQNCQILRAINANTIFLISPKDEMVPFEDSMELVKNFSIMCDQKCFFDVIRMNKGHKERRDTTVYKNAISTLVTKKGTKNQDRYFFELASSRIFSPETDTPKRNMLESIRPRNDRVSVLLKIPAEFGKLENIESHSNIIQATESQLPSSQTLLVTFSSNQSLPNSRPESVKVNSQNIAFVTGTKKIGNKSNFFGLSEAKMDSVQKGPSELSLPSRDQPSGLHNYKFPSIAHQHKNTQSISSTRHLIFEDKHSSPINTQQFNSKEQNPGMRLSAKFTANSIKTNYVDRQRGSRISPFGHESVSGPQKEFANPDLARELLRPPNLAFKSTTVEIPNNCEFDSQNELSNLMQFKSNQELSEPHFKAVTSDMNSQYLEGFHMSPGASKYISNTSNQNSMCHSSLVGDPVRQSDRQHIFDSAHRQPFRHLPTQSPNIQAFNPLNSPQKMASNILIKQSSIEAANLIQLSGFKSKNQSVQSHRFMPHSNSHRLKEGGEVAQGFFTLESDSFRKLPGHHD